MQRLALIFMLILVLCAAPVRAQSETPPPSPTRAPTQGELASATREFADAAERIGTQNVLMIAVVVGVLVIGGITFRPLIKSNNAANRMIVQQAANTSQAQLQSSQAQLQTAQHLAQVAETMKSIHEDLKHPEERFQGVVTGINNHTDGVKGEVAAIINPLIQKIEALITDIQQANEKTQRRENTWNETQRKVADGLTEIREELRHIRTAVDTPAAASGESKPGGEHPIDTNIPGEAPEKE